MSILQFLRILWAYWVLTVACTVATTLLAVVVVEVVKPRYEAESRVMLDVIKPDPVTGQVMSTTFVRAYARTQTELVKDLQVASRVVTDQNLTKDPYYLNLYKDRPRSQRDVEPARWIAEQVMEKSNAKVIEGSNILEISFQATSPERAKRLADGVRKAYIDMTLQSRREAARRNAEWYEQQAEKARSVLTQAENAKSEFERANGILLQDDKVDVDSARLAALAGQGSSALITANRETPPSAPLLAQVETELSEASKVLGPNHPTLQSLRARREMLEKQISQERAAAAASASAAMSAAQASSGLLEAQKSKVLSQREKVERLRLMQDDIDLRRDQYNKSVARAAELRQEAEIAEAGVIPLANAITPREPKFPKKALIIPAAVIAGLGMGIVLGLALEFLGRRVRSADDLAGAIKVPVLGVIRGAPRARKSKFGGLTFRFRPRRAQAAQV